MLEKLRPWFKRLIAPIARALTRMGITANAVTVIGAVGTTIVGIASGITGWMFWGALVLTILVVFDSLDGSVAAITTGGTKFGAFLDSTLDRIADWAVLLGCIIYFFVRNSTFTAAHAGQRYDWICVSGMALAIYSVMTSFVTSYARARAQSVGYEAKNGVATQFRPPDDHPGRHGHMRPGQQSALAHDRHGRARIARHDHRVPAHPRGLCEHASQRRRRRLQAVTARSRRLYDRAHRQSVKGEL